MRNLFEEILDMLSRGKRQEQQFDEEECRAFPDRPKKNVRSLSDS